MSRKRITSKEPIVAEINERVTALNATLQQAYEAGIKVNIQQDYTNAFASDDGVDREPLYLYKVNEISQVIYEGQSEVSGE